MRECFQFESMSMLDHGKDVRRWFNDLRSLVLDGKSSSDWRLPDWIGSPAILREMEDLDSRIVGLYQVYHDCGKPLCREVDAEGRQHFPCHAAASKARWLECADGSPEALEVAELIGMDMDVHQLRASGVEEFASRPQALVLLLTGLAEIHSNARMFGGIDSVGFKIKYKNIDRFGARIVAAKEQQK